jgi:hypothetical protein
MHSPVCFRGLEESIYHFRDSIFSPRTFVGNPCGFEALADLETARFRLNQRASANPGEYFVFDLRTKQVLVCLVSTSEELLADSRITSTGT